MKIKSSVYIATHPTDGEWHATSVVDVPLADALEHAQLSDIYHTLPDAERAMVDERGSMAISHDYTFNENYKEGVGMIMEGLNLDISKVRPEEREALTSWLRESYGAEVDVNSPDAAIQAAVETNTPHILADMSVSGMSESYFHEMVAAHARGEIGEDDYPSRDQVEQIMQSVESRAGGDLSAYFQRTSGMTDHWPSSTDKNYGGETPDEGQVIFYKGFQASSEIVTKAGPYAFVSAWPANAEFDEKGIARNGDGEIMPVADVKVDGDYVYYPHNVVTASYEGSKAESIVQGMLEPEVPLYDGHKNHCIGVSGPAALGDDYQKIPQRDGAFWNGEQLPMPDGLSYESIALQGDEPALANDHNRMQEAEQTMATQRMQDAARDAVANLQISGMGEDAAMKPGQAQGEQHTQQNARG